MNLMSKPKSRKYLSVSAPRLGKTLLKLFAGKIMPRSIYLGKIDV